MHVTSIHILDNKYTIFKTIIGKLYWQEWGTNNL